MQSAQYQIQETRSGDTLTFTALQNDVAAGFVCGEVLGNEVFAFTELSLAPESFENGAALQIVLRLGAFCAANGLKVLSTDDPRSNHINAVMELAEFHIAQKKFLFELSLEGFHSPRTDPFTYRSLNDIGENFFLPIISEAAIGDPLDVHATGSREEQFQELIERAGSAFDAASWFVAYRGEEPIGVILPQEYEDRPGLGTLFYLAVLPAHRGNGFGNILHATGLQMLADRGVKRYVGSTGDTNIPMIRVFRANGCRLKLTQLFFEPPR